MERHIILIVTLFNKAIEMLFKIHTYGGYDKNQAQ